jgi:hypothetical protein
MLCVKCTTMPEYVHCVLDSITILLAVDKEVSYTIIVHVHRAYMHSTAAVLLRCILYLVYYLCVLLMRAHTRYYEVLQRSCVCMHTRRAATAVLQDIAV